MVLGHAQDLCASCSVQACGWLSEPGLVRLALCDRGAPRPSASTPLCERKALFVRQFRSREPSASVRPEDAHVWSGAHTSSPRMTRLAPVMPYEFCISGCGRIRGCTKKAGFSAALDKSGFFVLLWALFPTPAAAELCFSLWACSLGVVFAGPTQCTHSRMLPGWLWKAFEVEVPGVGKTFRRQIQVFCFSRIFGAGCAPGWMAVAPGDALGSRSCPP